MIRRLIIPSGGALVTFLTIATTIVVIASAPAYSTTARVGFIALAVACFFASTVDWAYLVLRGLSNGSKVEVTVDEAYSIADEYLPIYTVLVPIFDRPDIAESLLTSLAQIDYPADKLDIYIIVAADDGLTLAAFEVRLPHNLLPRNVHLVETPAGAPRTKANACNYALSLPGERGDYVTMFGADEIPDRLQLRKVAYAFANASENVAVFQCKLRYYNENHNLLTKWGAIERDRWFSFVLPALSRINGVVPLGGSSSHIRKSLLTEVGGWDSSSATEEAETAIRFSRNGYRTLILDSYTDTKATATLRNWLRRRSRWYLAYLQTLGRRCRNPLQFYRDLGLIPLLRLLHLTIGWQVWCFANIVLWAAFVSSYLTDPSTSPPPLHPIYLLFATGNVIALLTGIVTTGASSKPQLFWAALLIPIYWLLQAIEAVITILNFMRIWFVSRWANRLAP